MSQEAEEEELVLLKYQKVSATTLLCLNRIS